MKRIGIIGGMSWESTATYYRLLNEGVKKRLGGFHSAECILYSVDFAEIESLQRQGRWREMGGKIVEAAELLRQGGAEGIIVCSNTMHEVADQIIQGCPLPFLHIAEATADCIHQADIRKVGLIGTQFTMERETYRGRLWDHRRIETIVPEREQQNEIHRIIFEELCQGIIREESRQCYLKVMQGLVDEGVEGIILGCTEINLLVNEEDANVPIFDTTRIHAEAALEWALK
ncbi:aspartate racemase [Marininema mesophilum]|uniref:Aspartate racemase n=1 Tax=Marininema mesophilum TaxID=1048340 RepID=A0A1H2YJB0_9BACL|nr:aspartate/glutamate racemase family protein [Marininema mesophilum]SDX05293.1 aspartate racemase [Marininema mesophilum]